jgi:gamma-glutamylcyclotransferase
MTSIQYFAYGSNMLTERLRARCKSATVRCAAAINGYRLAFSKNSQDGSGKATIYPCQEEGCRVYGMVFDLDESDLPTLDRFEGTGRGYDRVEGLRAQAYGTDRPFDVITYIAGPGYTNKNLKPYDWYLRLVAAGARQHTLPSDYVAAIEAVPSVNDPETDRPSRQEALKLLENIPS